MKNTIVAFHIGRGGQFNNAGHLSFEGEHEIAHFTSDLFLRYENENKFKERYGFDKLYYDVPCIKDLITDKDFARLETLYGITEEVLGEEMYYNEAGSEVGLTEAECSTGIGRIDIDGDYDTTYTKFLTDCTEKELETIASSGHWRAEALLESLALNEIKIALNNSN